MAKKKEARIARLYAGPEVVRDVRPSPVPRPGDPRVPRYPGRAERGLPYFAVCGTRRCRRESPLVPREHGKTGL